LGRLATRPKGLSRMTAVVPIALASLKLIGPCHNSHLQLSFHRFPPTMAQKNAAAVVVFIILQGKESDINIKSSSIISNKQCSSHSPPPPPLLQSSSPHFCLEALLKQHYGIQTTHRPTNQVDAPTNHRPLS